MNKNFVAIRGTIVHMFDTQRNCAIVTVKTGDHTFPKVVFHKALAEQVLKEYAVGMTIGIEGFLISSITGKGATQSVVASKLLHSDGEQTCNLFRLEGKVLQCWLYEKFCVVRLRVEQDGHVACIPVSLHLATTGGTVPKGIRVQGEGHLDTRGDRWTEEPRYFQNYFAHRMRVA